MKSKELTIAGVIKVYQESCEYNFNGDCYWRWAYSNEIVFPEPDINSLIVKCTKKCVRVKCFRKRLEKLKHRKIQLLVNNK